MAQILTFPKPSTTLTAFDIAPAAADPVLAVLSDQAEALAVFERLMAFHTETQRRMAEVLQAGAQTAAAKPEAEVIYYPLPLVG